MRNSVLLFVISLIFVFQLQAQEKKFDVSSLSEKGQSAYQILLKADRFALFGVGYDGDTSESEVALDSLVEDKEAKLAFKSLIVNATPEGAIYALVGLKMIDCDCFAEQMRIFEELPEPPERGKDLFSHVKKGYLLTQSGCIVSQQKKSKITKEIKTGKLVEIKVANYKAKR